MSELSQRPSVECSALTKRYRRKLALQEVTVSFSTGVNALLGANGAGKSTLIEIISTLTRPTSGWVKVGDAVTNSTRGGARERKALGYLPQRFDVLDRETVNDNVAYAAWVNGVEAREVTSLVANTLEKVGLTKLHAAKAKTLSGGQRQRLGIACAIAHVPEVVLLDEPTVGLDPVQRVGIRNLIAELGKEATVVMSTHLVDDVVELASRAVVLRDGQIVYDGETDDLVDRQSENHENRARSLERALMELMV